MPKKPSFKHHKYSPKEQRRLTDLLLNCKEYKERTLIGPKTNNKKGQCVVVDDHNFHNPYYPRGPKKFSIQQLVYVIKTGFLPDNTGIRNTKIQIDLSHVCHRSNCVNMQDRHIVAEEHWKNDRRRQHLKEIISTFRDICKGILEVAKSVLLRGTTKMKAYIRCIDCPELCKNCDCVPPCFKNFNECCPSLLTE